MHWSRMLDHLSDILECPWLKVHHMYISLHSPLHRRHLPDPTSMQSKFPRTLSVECGRLAQWPSLLMIFSVPDEAQVCCVALSTNEKYIAVGLNDGNAYVWNALNWDESKWARTAPTLKEVETPGSLSWETSSHLSHSRMKDSTWPLGYRTGQSTSGMW